MSKIIRIEELVYSRLPHVSKADWIAMLIDNGVNPNYTTILNDYLLLEYADYRFQGEKMLSSERRVYNIDYCTYDLEENADAEDDTLEITYVNYNRSTDRYIVRYAHYPASEEYTAPELPYVFSESDAPEVELVEPKMILPQPAESPKVEFQISSIPPGILDSPNLKKYQNYFASLKRSNRNGEHAPHKLILMLAIMKLYESPKQYKTVLVKLTPELIELFNHYWREYVNSPIWIMDINMPWTHMKSEPFWHECYNTAKGCWIDEELKTLFRNVYYREALRQTLVEQLEKDTDTCEFLFDQQIGKSVLIAGFTLPSYSLEKVLSYYPLLSKPGFLLVPIRFEGEIYEAKLTHVAYDPRHNRKMTMQIRYNFSNPLALKMRTVCKHSADLLAGRTIPEAAKESFKVGYDKNSRSFVLEMNVK